MKTLATAARPIQPELNTHGLSREEIITGLRSSPEIVDGWLSGRSQRPPYFDKALRAVKAGLHPIAKPLVMKYGKDLGVDQARVNYWLKTEQVPVPARLAVSWIIHARVTGRT